MKRISKIIIISFLLLTGCMNSTYFEDLSSKNLNQSHYNVNNPKLISNDKIIKIKSTEYGNEATCALFENGILKCWGQNTNGILGLGDTIERYSAATVNGFHQKVIDFELSPFFGCALLEDRSVKCWGDNTAGQLGINSTVSYQLAPNEKVILDQKVIKLSIGSMHACALLENKTVKCWGHNLSGQIGDNSFENRLVPTTVLNLTNIDDIYVSIYNSFALSNGKLYCWGSSVHGTCGSGSTAERVMIPEEVVGLSSGVTKIKNSVNSTCAIQSGSLKCWGSNNFGQLGNGTKVNSLVPQQVFGLESGVSEFDMHFTTTCAIQNGSLKCWGLNFYGEFGVGDRLESLIPKQALNMTENVTAIDVNYSTVCVIKNKSQYCAGPPTLVGTLDGIINYFNLSDLPGIEVNQISTGYAHNCFVGGDEVYCHGMNTFGECAAPSELDYQILPRKIDQED